jgi:hypothetical protein
MLSAAATAAKTALLQIMALSRPAGCPCDARGHPRASVSSSAARQPIARRRACRGIAFGISLTVSPSRHRPSAIWASPKCDLGGRLNRQDRQDAKAQVAQPGTSLSRSPLFLAPWRLGGSLRGRAANHKTMRIPNAIALAGRVWWDLVSAHHRRPGTGLRGNRFDRPHLSIGIAGGRCWVASGWGRVIKKKGVLAANERK